MVAVINHTEITLKTKRQFSKLCKEVCGYGLVEDQFKLLKIL